MPKEKRILILGLGNILFSDEGVGIRVVERLQELYEFPENVSIMDGGVLGLSLLGLLAEVDHLIVVDAVKSRKEPGTLYRLMGEDVPKRFLAKRSLHEVDFLEVLTACQVLEKLPETVILGIEPLDMESLGTELTPSIQEKVGDLVGMALKELEALGIGYRMKGVKKDVCGHTCQDHQD